MSLVQDTDFKAFSLERLDNSVLRIWIDHPTNELNAVDDLLHTEIMQLFQALKQEDEARAIILTGRGKAFSAGGDFNWFPQLDSTSAREHLRRDAKQLIWDLLDIDIPVIAAINGPAIGLGASIALLCDTTFMAHSAVIADPHVKVGIVAGDGGTVIWPLLLGPARAKQYLLTGDPVSASEAERIGLVNTITSDDQLQSSALAFATRLARGAPLAIRYTKQSVNKLVKDALNIAFDTATALEIVTMQSADHKEALAAIKQKRAPNFKGE
jgi:enoyl-CoA hydratase